MGRTGHDASVGGWLTPSAPEALKAALLRCSPVTKLLAMRVEAASVGLEAQGGAGADAEAVEGSGGQLDDAAGAESWDPEPSGAHRGRPDHAAVPPDEREVQRVVHAERVHARARLDPQRPGEPVGAEQPGATLGGRRGAPGPGAALAARNDAELIGFSVDGAGGTVTVTVQSRDVVPGTGQRAE